MWRKGTPGYGSDRHLAWVVCIALLYSIAVIVVVML
jgi:hypothetical protein